MNKKEENIKKEFKKIFEDNAKIFENLSLLCKKITENFDEIYEYMKSTDNDLINFKEILNEDNEHYHEVFMSYMAIYMGKELYLSKKEKINNAKEKL